MSEDEFLHFLAACREELARLQLLFQQRIKGRGQWSYDLSDCTLLIGDETFPITPAGTYSQEYESWLWAWANEELPARARDAAKCIQSLQTATGWRVFTSPKISASQTDAQDFAALAVHCLGSIGLFRVPGTPALYLAVHEPRTSK